MSLAINNNSFVPLIPHSYFKEEVDEQGKTELFRAVEKGDFKKVTAELKRGADPNCLALDGRSMLFAAMEYFNPKVLEVEKVNHTSKQYDLIELLLNYGANPKLGFSPGALHAFDKAVSLINHSLLNILSKYTSEKHPFSQDAIDMFLSFATPDSLEEVLHLFPQAFEEIYEHNYTTLHMCVFHKKRSLLEVLFRERPDFFNKALFFRATDKDAIFQNETPLDESLFGSSPDFELATFLVKKALFPHEWLLSLAQDSSLTKEKRAWLQSIVKNIPIQAESRLLEEEESSDPQKAFLQVLPQRNKEKISKLLDEMSYTYKIKDSDGNNIFHLLVQLGDKALLQKAAKKFSDCALYGKNKENKQPLEVAQALGYDDLVEVLWHALFELAKFEIAKNGGLFWQNEFCKMTIEIGNKAFVENVFTHPFFKNSKESERIRIKEYCLECDLVSYAAFCGNKEVLLFFLEQQAPLQKNEGFFSSVPPDEVLFFALLSQNQACVDEVVAAYNTRGQLPHHESLYHAIVYESKKTKRPELLFSMTLKCIMNFLRPELQKDIREEVVVFLEKSCAPHVRVSIVKYLFSSFEPREELRKGLYEVGDFVQSVAKIVKVNFGHLSLKETCTWITTQVFQHIFMGMNPQLANEPRIFHDILKMLKLVEKVEDYGFLFVALQTAPSMDLASFAFQAAKEKEQKALILPLNTIEEQKKWLAYTAVFRDRKGLSFCYDIIRRSAHYKELLPFALQALERIAIPRKKNSDLLMRVIVESESQEHKIFALRALVATSESIPKEFICGQLQQARRSAFFEFEVALLQALRRCWNEETKEVAWLTDVLLEKLEGASHLVFIEIIHTLSTLPDKRALHKAIDLVKSQAWDPFTKDFGTNFHDVVGDFFTFRARPKSLHENRAAMIERMQNRLVELHGEALSPREHLPSLKNLEIAIRTGMSQHIRYTSTPFFYPKGTDLIRGLSARKGDTGFIESIRDLLRKGCGSSSLTDNEASMDGGTWKKIGHVFTSHCKELFFSEEDGCTYFSAQDGVVQNSALVIVPASFYHTEYYHGQARIEREGTYNNVFYRGIPKEKIRYIYLPQNMKADVLLVAGKNPINAVVSHCTSDLFSDLSEKELLQFRRYLQLDDFYKKIRFLEEGNAKSVLKQLETDGCQFASEEEVIYETLKMAQGRILLEQKYQEQDPWLFYTQDRLLRELDDAQFTHALPTFLRMIPLAWQKWLDGDGISTLNTEGQTGSQRVLIRLKALFRKNCSKELFENLLLQHHRFFGLSLGSLS